ncbi:hypothetical protein PCO82_06395 [Pectobacteriaceae bacterium CE90]|nr:hypothetical protein PCO82_06395 [Pectobacteriaceae bacterium CE90]
MPGADKNSEQWPAEARFAAIVETATKDFGWLRSRCQQHWYKTGNHHAVWRHFPVLPGRSGNCSSIHLLLWGDVL